MEIKITIALDERAHATLNRLVDALTKGTTLTAPTPAPQPIISTATHGTGAQESPTPVVEAEVKEAAAPPAKSPERGNGAATEANKPVAIEELRALAADAKTKQGSNQPVKALLAEFGATKLSEIPAEQTAAFAKRLEELT